MNKDQNNSRDTASGGKRRSVSSRIVSLIMLTAAALGLFSILVTVYMFYRESRHIRPEGGTEDPVLVLTEYIIVYLVLMIAAAAVITILVRRYTVKHLVKPIDRISDAISGYMKDKSDGSLDEAHFSGLEVNTEDELTHLAFVLRDMEQSINEYERNLMRITREKERISTELDLAKRIQAEMLPSVFPPYPERKDIDIYAVMDPAKEVGGDFYDFFLLDDDHLVMVMADVSGKGIPAALFMMMVRIMINSMALSGAPPRTVLENVNNKICENNREEMFVTVWMGVLTISTGSVTAVNAGHEYPFLCQGEEGFELWKDPHCFVVGGMEGVRYREYSFTLKRGGTLFLYTDGLPEATKAGNEMFGTDRILQVLNKNRGAGVREILKKMTEEVALFVGKEPQFDDLTMMAVRLTGTSDAQSEYIAD